jgi:hypothetical protein
VSILFLLVCPERFFASYISVGHQFTRAMVLLISKSTFGKGMTILTLDRFPYRVYVCEVGFLCFVQRSCRALEVMPINHIITIQREAFWCRGQVYMHFSSRCISSLAAFFQSSDFIIRKQSSRAINHIVCFIAHRDVSFTLRTMI